MPNFPLHCIVHFELIRILNFLSASVCWIQDQFVNFHKIASYRLWFLAFSGWNRIILFFQKHEIRHFSMLCNVGEGLNSYCVLVWICFHIL